MCSTQTEELKEEMIHEGMKEYIFRRKNEDAMNKMKSDQETFSETKRGKWERI